VIRHFLSASPPGPLPRRVEPPTVRLTLIRRLRLLHRAPPL